jgi:hypothetical protein
MQPVTKALIGAMLGLALGGALIYGVVQLSHWIVGN